MRTYVLRINFNNLRKEINDNYFLYKDIFYKCFIANVYSYCINNKDVSKNIFIDNAHYWQYFVNAINIKQPIKSMLYELSIDKYVNIFLDMNLYIEEFINMKHDRNALNIYSLDISDTYYLEIKNKHIKNKNYGLAIKERKNG